MTKVHATTTAREAETSAPARTSSAISKTAPPVLAAKQPLPALTEYPMSAPQHARYDLDGPGLLATLRPHVVAAVAEELAHTDWSAEQCPWLDYWFSYYEGRSTDDLERALRKYAPEARDAKTAEDYVPAIVARVRRSIARWRETGDIDSPAGVDTDRGANGEWIGNSDLVAVEALDDARSLTALPPALTSTLGSSFADVKIHSGPTAAQLAERADAVAFTLGNHVVIGANAPRPGSLEGDALLAHELAHVAQQRGAAPTDRAGITDSAAREANADAAVAQAAPGYLGFGGAIRGAWNAISAPLGLSRCTNKEKEKRIKELEQRKTELGTTYSTSTSFSQLARTDAELTATEHWLAVLQSGRGGTTGSWSGEQGLPKCNCTTYVADVLERTYKKLGRPKDWEAVHAKALELNPKGEHGLNGLEMQSALMSVRGWKAIYFAPDPTYKHYRKRKRDAQGHPIPGPDGQPLWEADEHASWTYRQVKQGKKYRNMFNVSHMVVNYRPEAANPEGPTPVQSTTAKDTSQLDKLATIPFGVVTVRGAYHMALLIYGVVYEAHLNMTSGDLDLYERKPLAEWGWNEGVVVAPPDEVDKAFGKP